MYTNMSTNGIVKIPGNDGMGGGCEVNSGAPGVDVAKNRNIFVAGTNSDLTYNATAWAHCCKDHSFTFQNSCYLYCDVPEDIVGKDKDRSRILSAMADCIGENNVTHGLQPSGGHAPAPALPALLAAGLVFVYMFV
ncbi:hypothetical protein NLG97_g2357 [Lecanicillium saksenae]|uniref:Uncharacterized protein n=1 Tax=Lecanicillium saksenae TaxID=468837 RepID=A0ACC1R185_9HYPO|nr:hypothetical protein NLG97_g2357 [Lecanicillium saksenae]